ncbi:putative transposase, partial [Tremellales sp. Uapishka_1]
MDTDTSNPSSIYSIPKLRNNLNYATWFNTVENALLVAGCMGILDGTDVEPYWVATQVVQVLDAAGQPTTTTVEQVIPRTTRAGSAAPSVNPDGGNALDTRQLAQWREWSKREQKVQGILRMTVSDGLKVDIMYMKTAKEMWEYLKAAHQLDTSEMRADIRRSLALLRLGKDATAEEMDSHMERYNSLTLQSYTAGLLITEAERVQTFLDTLPTDCFHIKSQLKALLAPTWQDLKTYWNTEVADRSRESKRETTTTATAMVAFNGKRKGGKPMGKANDKRDRVCYNCQQKGHFKADCTNPHKERPQGDRLKYGAKQGNRKEKSEPDGVAMVSHAMEGLDAFLATAMGKLPVIATPTPQHSTIGFWDEDKFESNKRNRLAKVLAMEAQTREASSPGLQPQALQVALEPSQPTQFEFILDSGATHHVTPNRNFLSCAQTLDPPMVFNLANDASTMTAYAVGKVVGQVETGEKVILQTVYWTPSARVSLISASVLADKGWSVRLGTSPSLVKGRLRLTLNRVAQLWTVRLGSTPMAMLTAPAMTNPARSELEVEHQRLGHLGITKILELAKNGHTSTPYQRLKEDRFKIEDCSVCGQANAVRQPKTDESQRGNKEGEIIHVDLSGPFKPSLEGNNNLLAMVADYSSICSVVPLVGKVDVLDHVKRFVARIERQTGLVVKIIRSDNGGEFDSGKARAWYDRKGILHQRSTVYTPELNGAAERFIRTVKDMMAAMLLDSGLGHGYWDYAARYATVVLMKTSAINPKGSAWYQLTHRLPNVKHIKRFGEPCYVQVPRERRDKSSFENMKGESGVVLGQDEEVSGWIVKIDGTGTIRRSRDVRFTSIIDHPPVMDALPKRIEAPQLEPEVVDVEVIDDEVEEIDGEVERNEEEQSEGEPEAERHQHEEGRPDHLRTHLASPPLPPPPKRKVRPSWEYVPYPPTEEQRELARTRSGKVPSSYMTYQGPRARETYLASEMVGRMVLSTEMDDDEPRTVRQALSGPNKKQWLASMKVELDNIESKGTWEETRLPPGRKAIGCRWVFKRKRGANGEIIKYKSRLVAKGYSQIPGVDFEETFAPVGRTTSLRIMLTIAASMDLEIHQADVEGAYLNGKLDVEIFMEYPEGMVKSKSNNVLKLKGSLYGLKQSGRTWWIELGEGLADLGFKKLESDWGLYYRPPMKGREGVLVLAYVDDILIAARTKKEIRDIMDGLKKRWKMTEMGEVGYLLGLKVTRKRSERKIWLTQPAYIEKMVDRFPMKISPRTVSTPLGTDHQKTKDDDEATPLTAYQEMIGCLQWIATCTRPDISFAASFLARHTANPLQSHHQMALRTISYLNQTKGMGLTLGGKVKPLEGWVDADWAGDRDTQKSTTGWVFKLNGSPIVWSSKRQDTVAASTVEAEYQAVAHAAREAVWLRNLLEEIGITSAQPTLLRCDNQGAIRLAHNPTTHQRTKHIDIKHHIIRDLINRKVVTLEYVATGRQEADLLTKALPGPRHTANTMELGIGRPPPGPSMRV